MESLSLQATKTQQRNGMHGGTGDFVAKSAVRESQLYKRILGQSLKQAGLPALAADGTWESNPLTASNTNANANQGQSSTHIVPPKSAGSDSITSPSASVNIPSLTEEENQNLVRQVAEMAATAATVAARDAARAPRKSAGLSHPVSHPQPALRRTSTFLQPDAAGAHGHDGAGQDQGGGGHDAPNWSKTKSCIILVTATLAYAVIAEILVDTVDVVLQNVDIDEKFLGITLFALVPNTTEFLVCNLIFILFKVSSALLPTNNA
jgi:Ca2+:H+ antiporter